MISFMQISCFLFTYNIHVPSIMLGFGYLVVSRRQFFVLKEFTVVKDKKRNDINLLISACKMQNAMKEMKMLL